MFVSPHRAPSSQEVLCGLIFVPLVPLMSGKKVSENMNGCVHFSFRARFELCFLELFVCCSSSHVCVYNGFVWGRDISEAGRSPSQRVCLEASTLPRIIVTFVVITVLSRCLIYLLELVCLVCLWEFVIRD